MVVTDVSRIKVRLHNASCGVNFCGSETIHENCKHYMCLWYRIILSFHTKCVCIINLSCFFRTLFSDEFSNFISLSAPELLNMFERYSYMLLPFSRIILWFPYAQLAYIHGTFFSKFPPDVLGDEQIMQLLALCGSRIEHIQVHSCTMYKTKRYVCIFARNASCNTNPYICIYRFLGTSLSSGYSANYYSTSSLSMYTHVHYALSTV